MTHSPLSYLCPICLAAVGDLCWSDNINARSTNPHGPRLRAFESAERERAEELRAVKTPVDQVW